VVAEARCSPCAKDRSGEKAEADGAEGAGLGESLFADIGGGIGGEGVVEAFRYIAKISGDEGGVVGEAVDATEAGDLNGGDVGDGSRKNHLGKAAMEPAEDEDGDNLQAEAEDGGADSEAGAQVFGGDDAGEEGDEGYNVRGDIPPIVAEDGDAKEDDVAGHGVGEDVAMIEVDDSVEQSAGGCQEHGFGECAGLNGGIVVGHGGWRQSESIVNAGLACVLRLKVRSKWGLVKYE
jgi:hypothetical protein